MDAELVLDKLRNHFISSGFNLILTISPAKYKKAQQVKNNLDDLAPDAKSIILVGFAGKDFWEIFQNYLHSNPEFREDNADPIDNYTLLKFSDAANILDSHGVKHTSVYPFGDRALDLNFVKLAELGGAGVPSLLGILLHPKYGTWISLRGALITNLELSSFDKPLSDFDPCPSCSKPCITACPAQTISLSGWDWEACMRFRLKDSTCDRFCASRLACPYGKDEQYPGDQILYHHSIVLKNARKYLDDID